MAILLFVRGNPICFAQQRLAHRIGFGAAGLEVQICPNAESLNFGCACARQEHGALAPQPGKLIMRRGAAWQASGFHNTSQLSSPQEKELSKRTRAETAGKLWRKASIVEAGAGAANARGPRKRTAWLYRGSGVVCGIWPPRPATKSCILELKITFGTSLCLPRGRGRRPSDRFVWPRLGPRQCLPLRRPPPGTKRRHAFESSRKNQFAQGGSTPTGLGPTLREVCFGLAACPIGLGRAEPAFPTSAFGIPMYSHVSCWGVARGKRL